MEVYTEHNRLYSGDYWQHMSVISILPGYANFISVAPSGTDLRGQHQVSYLAWTHDHVPFHRSWPVLHRLLGSHGSFSIQGKYYWNLDLVVGDEKWMAVKILSSKNQSSECHSIEKCQIYKSGL